MVSDAAKKAGLLAMVVAAMSAAVLVIAMMPPPSRVEHQYSFESDMQGWSANGTDLEHDGSTLMWSIIVSGDRATNGTHSLRFYLNNLNDKGKIWIEKGFPAAAGKLFLVKVEYDLASQDFGNINLWTIITGALSDHPRTADDLVHCYQGNTWNGRENDSGFVWTHKSYNLSARGGADGLLRVAIGVWGTWETARGYYLDNVHVIITEG